MIAGFAQAWVECKRYLFYSNKPSKYRYNWSKIHQIRLSQAVSCRLKQAPPPLA
jgi:hypothetical protein